MNENELETTPEETSTTIVNMYPSVKEQVTTTALVSLVSIAIPLAALGVMAGVGHVVSTVRTVRENRKSKKEARLLSEETNTAAE